MQLLTIAHAADVKNINSHNNKNYSSFFYSPRKRKNMKPNSETTKSVVKYFFGFFRVIQMESTQEINFMAY
jgi:hypothetical protein